MIDSVSKADMDCAFQKVKGGWIAFKTFGEWFAPQRDWVIESGSKIFVAKGTFNPDRYQDCVPGIHFGVAHYVYENSFSDNIWRVFIPSSAHTVVPHEYGSSTRRMGRDFKARTTSLVLLDVRKAYLLKQAINQAWYGRNRTPLQIAHEFFPLEELYGHTFGDLTIQKVGS